VVIPNVHVLNKVVIQAANNHDSDVKTDVMVYQHQQLLYLSSICNFFISISAKTLYTIATTNYNNLYKFIYLNYANF